MPEQPPANSEPIHQDVDYETSDARLSLLGWTGLGLVALILFGVFVSLIVFNIFSGIMDASDPGLSPVAAKDRLTLPRDIDRIPISANAAQKIGTPVRTAPDTAIPKRSR